MEKLTGKEALERFINFAYEVRFEDLSEKAVAETTRRIIDALGCAFGSLSDEKVVKLRAQWRCKKVSGDAGLVLGMPDDLILENAAFLNTAMIRWLDWNDTYLAKEPAHPSDNIGLLLALAGSNKISGKDFITAVAVAYEIQCRLCEATSLRSRGWDHVNYLLISSTLAGAKLLGLTKKQMYDAVAIALNHGIALRQVRAGSSLSEWKGCSAAGAVKNAAFALELVYRAGFSGPSDIMDGEFGFVKQVCGALDPKALDGLGREFLIAETYIKKYPVEYHAQATVENALAIRQKLGEQINPDEVREIHMVTYEAAERIIGDHSKRRPTTKETADHSIFYIFAVTLLKGEMTLRQYAPELFRDPKVLALIDKIRLERSFDFTADYTAPRQRREFTSFAEVILHDGKRASDFRNLPHGHPRNPMSDIEVSNKFLQLATHWQPNEDDRVEILQDLWTLETEEDIGKFFRNEVR